MKKRIIFFNSFILLISLLALYISFIVIINNINTSNSNDKITSYLEEAVALYDGENHDEVYKIFNTVDSTIRLTIISKDGKVIYDSNTNLTENHLNRPEILNLNKIYKRYSESLGCDMLYIAQEDEGNYLRISIPVDKLDNYVNIYIGFGIVFVLGIFAVSFLLIFYFSRRSIDAVNKNVNNLAKLANDDLAFSSLSVDDLPKVLDLLSEEFTHKISQISHQKQQTYTVLNEMKEGVVVVDDEEIIKLINSPALEIFNTSLERVAKKNFLYLIRDISLQNLIKDSLANHRDNNYLFYSENNKTYFINIKHLEADWLGSGLIITFSDITDAIKLEQTKRDFFANASHELKSPLTCIIGYQQMITEGIITDLDSIIEYSKKTITEANRMNNIIVDMLNLSKFEKQESMKIVELDLELIIKEVLDSLESVLKMKNIKVILDSKSVVKNMDMSHALALVRNLIDNAIKYNKEAGSIKITLDENHLVIEDTGIGIPIADQTRIFERFYRVDKAKSKTLGGTGLGLAIVKHVCEIYNFKISVDSKLDIGTKFDIKL